MQILFGLVAVLVICGVIFIFGKVIAENIRNSRAPIQTVSAFVLKKSTSTSTNHQPVMGDATGAHGFFTSSSTSYRVTFQLESGESCRMPVRSSEYRAIEEGDTGMLTYQGTRFISFERN